MADASAFDPNTVLRRDLHRLRRLRASNMDAWRKLKDQSAQHLTRRQSQTIAISYPSVLPITAHAEEIKRLLGDHQVLVVAGETGSGKTTQLPKMCLQAGFGYRGMIGHTQPRRLAARAVAARVAEELGVSVGEAVGYAVRFSDQVGDNTLIKLMTDGLLLNEITRDRDLDNYEVIIVDEAHERSLNVDFLLGYLKRLLSRRADLKLIITSATIDVDSFSRHFGDAPIVEVGGRGYPVETRYLEVEQSAEQTLAEQILDCVQDIETQPGQGSARDILVFQSGEREIFETAHALRKVLDERIEILPLYARLSARDQQRVFRPSGYRRVVLATNVAETSLTVPNIGYVIDPGFARISRYSYRSKLQRLPVEPVSQASANQRQGRCGRVAPGVCFRLYGEQDFLARPEFTDPEIQRTNLAQVVLQMRSLGLGSVASFPFLDPPDPRAVRDAERLLDELDAFGKSGLSKIGRTMARLPVDPRLARMLIAADEYGSMAEVLIIVSALAVQDPRERPMDRQGSADRAHLEFVDPRSDFLAFVNIWRWYVETRQRVTRSALRRELGKRFLSSNRMREWHEMHRQLLLATRQLGMRVNEAEADYPAVHRALLRGSLSLIGFREEKGNYLGPRNLRFRIFPGSALARGGPKWLIAGEINETQRIYARSVASVEPKWIEEGGAKLVKRQYSEPHWSVRRGEVVAHETVTLYGLRLVERRTVSYQDVDQDLCRALFLSDGLVRGGVSSPFEFLAHNQQLVQQIVEQEAKGRRRDLLIAEAAQADLYADRLPVGVCSVTSLVRWLKGASEFEKQRLFFDTSMLIDSSDAGYLEVDYPSTLPVRGAELPIRYRFAPGEADDGVSVEVPIGVLNTLVGEALEWSVPGFFGRLAEQWLRTLPKQKRRRLAPMPDKLAEILPILLQPGRYRQGRLLPALAEVIGDLYSVSIQAVDWDRARVDTHLLVNVRVVDGHGKLLAQGRDLGLLKAEFADQINSRTSAAADEYQQAGLLEFPDLRVAGNVMLDDSAGQVVAYPGLLDEGEAVALKLFTDPKTQQRANRDGYARLALLAVTQTTRYLKKTLSKDAALGLHYASMGNHRALTDELLRATAWHCFFDGKPLPQTADEFAKRVADHRGELAEVFSEVSGHLKVILQKRFELVNLCNTMSSPAYEIALADVAEQLAALVPADVLTVTPREYLAEIPRYLDAIGYRLTHLQGKVARDEEQIPIIRNLRERVSKVDAQAPSTQHEVVSLRFAVEELRIVLFAEPLRAKTNRGKVSPKRLDRELADLERELGLI
jgi:ATP-dependent helicase HrpA